MANNIFKEIEKNNMQGVRRSVAVFPSSVHARTPQVGFDVLGALEQISTVVSDLSPTGVCFRTHAV